MKRARYICLEGNEGVGKTTQTKKIAEYLRSKGYSVLETKEPGTPLLPLTMVLRGIMLDMKYDKEHTKKSRELISQAIRSIHLEKLISPARREYDYIIQDRGIMSGIAYGTQCGNSFEWLEDMADTIINDGDMDIGEYLSCYNLYDDVVYLIGNVSDGLSRALTSKKEFEGGDAMEARGDSFLSNVSKTMDILRKSYNATVVNIDGKNIDEVFGEIVEKLKL